MNEASCTRPHDKGSDQGLCVAVGSWDDTHTIYGCIRTIRALGKN